MDKFKVLISLSNKLNNCISYMMFENKFENINVNKKIFHLKMNNWFN